MMRPTKKKAQAVLEMAIFATVIVFVLGVLISYTQRMNDQQFVKMESFRRALQKANTYQGKESESSGASVQMFQVQDRRHADVDGGELFKGTTQSFSSDSSVFWAVPTESAYYGEQIPDQNLVFGKINDEEEKVGEFPNEFFVNSSALLGFEESYLKAEDMGAMTNRRYSEREEQVITTIPGMNIPQFSYRDPEGQYKYSKEVPEENRRVERQMTWQTN